MPIPWITVLKAVPWGDVISNAPVVVDGARKLWNTVGRKVGRDAEASAPAAPPGGEASAAPAAPWDTATELARLQARLHANDTRLEALHDQMITSSELIKALAEQNGQLIARIDTMRRRGAWLAVGLVVTLVVALIALARALPAAG